MHKYIDFRNITNFEIHLPFLAAGLLQDKAFRKGLVNVYIFHQPIALSKTDDFKITLRDEGKGSEDYIKISHI